MTTTKQYDRLDRLASIASAPGGSGQPPVTFSYWYNEASQRVRTTLADGSYWLYEYDRLGQVRSGRKYWGDGTPVAGQQFEYGHDDIGNRTQTKAGGDENGANLRTAGYSANSLNQYTSRTVSGYREVLGVALANATVTVNNQSTYRKGEYFRKELSVNNSSAAVWQSVSVAATGETTVNGNVFVPKTPEAFTHDLDGNLTADGRWDYTWDGENRLVRMVANTSAGPQQRIDFEYDWKGRRIGKKVWGNTSGSGDPDMNLRFVCDDWNLIAILGSQSSILQSFVWGLDLSGTLQGAGGVGGLLAVNDVTEGAHFCAYDGNGNVALLVKVTDGTTSANYEYDPFGEVIRATGPMAQANPFRFSTKYQDDESDFLYYGYRYYNPSTGRWPNRDPIGERGGRNLYGFVRNNPINLSDYLGLAAKKCKESLGWDRKPLIGFDPQPPKGGWKVKIAFEKDGSAQARMIDRIEAKWEASVAVLCKCDGCYEIRHGTRVHEDDERGAWLVYDPTGLPTSPFPITTTLGGIVGGIIADAILEGISGGVFIPATQAEADGIAKALRDLYGRRPTKPTDGSWKDGKSPCD